MDAQEGDAASLVFVAAWSDASFAYCTASSWARDLTRQGLLLLAAHPEMLCIESASGAGRLLEAPGLQRACHACEAQPDALVGPTGRCGWWTVAQSLAVGVLICRSLWPGVGLQLVADGLERAASVLRLSMQCYSHRAGVES